MYEKILKQAQLSDDEILIYQFLLNKGDSPASLIIDKTPLKRGTTYNILRSLEEKDLLEKIKEGKKTIFRLKHPRNITKYIETQEQNLIQAKKSVDLVMPNLISDFNLSENMPGVYFYEGKIGIKKIYEELLAEKQPIDSIEDKGEMVKFIPNYSREFTQKRMKYNIFNRVIAPSSNPINVTSKEELRETRYVPLDKFPFSMDIKICANKVSTVTFQKKSAVGILIENPEIAKNYKFLFNLLWGCLSKE